MPQSVQYDTGAGKICPILGTTAHTATASGPFGARTYKMQHSCQFRHPWYGGRVKIITPYRVRMYWPRIGLRVDWFGIGVVPPRRLRFTARQKDSPRRGIDPNRVEMTRCAVDRCRDRLARLLIGYAGFACTIHC